MASIANCNKLPGQVYHNEKSRRCRDADLRPCPLFPNGFGYPKTIALLVKKMIDFGGANGFSTWGVWSNPEGTRTESNVCMFRKY